MVKEDLTQISEKGPGGQAMSEVPESAMCETAMVKFKLQRRPHNVGDARGMEQLQRKTASS